jgi:hypothetical protein
MPYKGYRYGKYQQYAQKFSPHYWGDLVHNIWLRYFVKHGKDLFREASSNRWIYVAVKNEFINSMYGTDRFESILRPQVDDVTDNVYEAEFIPSDIPSALEITIYNDLDKFIKSHIKEWVSSRNKLKKPTAFTKLSGGQVVERHLSVYELLKFGCTPTEIGQELNIFGVKKYIDNIKEAIHSMGYSNPFNGSHTKVTKAISQNTWQTSKKGSVNRYDKSEYELEDYNEFYELYVHRESGEGLLVKLPDQDINPYIKNAETIGN